MFAEITNMLHLSTYNLKGPVSYNILSNSHKQNAYKSKFYYNSKLFLLSPVIAISPSQELCNIVYPVMGKEHSLIAGIRVNKLHIAL